MTLEQKLKNKYNGDYKKVFDKEFQKTVKRTDQSRKIFSKANIICVKQSAAKDYGET